MIATCLRRLADWLEPRTIDLTPWTPPPFKAEPEPATCSNCGWDDTRDTTPLLADLLEQARAEGARDHCMQANTGIGRRPLQLGPPRALR